MRSPPRCVKPRRCWRDPRLARTHATAHAPRSGRGGRPAETGSTEGPRGRWRARRVRRTGVPVILWAWALLIRLLRVLRSAMSHAGPLFECWNKTCPKYIGMGFYLTTEDVWSAADNLIRCRHCHSYVLHKSEPDSAGAAVASGSAGAVAGAAAGAAVGGPIGALIGMAAAGLVVAVILSERQKRGRRPKAQTNCDG